MNYIYIYIDIDTNDGNHDDNTTGMIMNILNRNDKQQK